MPRLQALDLDLEIVTPLMSGGAARQAEVRPPSFRGMMRYWLRALLGGIFGPSLPLVSAVEGGVFGHQGHASTVSLRVRQGAPAGALPPAGGALPGLGYLYYTAYQAKRDAVLPGQRIQLRLQSRPFTIEPIAIDGADLDAETRWNLGLASFWLMTRLGGLGLRMRRGAGNLRLLAEPDGWPAALPPALVRAAAPADYAAELATDLARLRRAFDWDPTTTLRDKPSFSILHPAACQIYVLDQVYDSWETALDTLGRAFMAFRSRQPEDYAAVKGALTRPNWRISGVKRSVFGLPLMFYFSSLYKQLLEQGVPQRDARSRASGQIVPRRDQSRASPLWVRVVRLNGDQPAYAVQMALFHSQFTSDGMLTLRPSDRNLRPIDFPAPANFGYVQEWFDHVAKAVAPVVPATFE